MRHRSFSSTMRSLARAAAQAERARQRAEGEALVIATRSAREADRRARAAAKDAERDYIAARMEETEALNLELRAQERAIESLLASALARSPAVDLEKKIKTFNPAVFDESRWPSDPPLKDLPEAPGILGKLLPGAAARQRQRVLDAEFRYQAALVNYERERRIRDATFADFQRFEDKRRSESEQENSAIRDIQRGLLIGDHAAVISYFEFVIDASLTGDYGAISAEIGYSPDSKHLVLDVDLPDFEIIPDQVSFKYVKSADRIDPVPRTAASRKALYSNLICQIALKSIDAVFRGGAPSGIVDCLTVNGMLDTIDPANGRNVRVCLLSVRVTADTFRTLNLAQVQPEHCLRLLKASVSRAPEELVPVKPLVELNMVDPRFIETVDVMTGLEQRPNLMDLSPNEFEGLITNLFALMGLDTRQTRASRDGGVDCVAFDSRPIFGGKVVIQAKRYKNTVGVSAVRDLFGTVQNEGASKGILVTTSGYGKAAFEFAAGKPLELLDGGNLLHLLAEHARIEARIVVPEAWVDLPLHGE